MRSIYTDLAIIGAGPTGLGAAWRIMTSAAESSDRPSFLVIDERPRPGGNAASHRTPEGFTFDYGGHVLFPHSEYAPFIRLLDDLVPAWHDSPPARFIWMNGRLIPKPIQRNIHRLPFPEFLRCLASIIRLQRMQSRTVGEAAFREDSLSTFLVEQFGQRLAGSVMFPLNHKMWAYQPEDLCADWVEHRSGSPDRNIPNVSFKRLLRNCLLRRDDTSWSDGRRVRYPMDGGTGSIWDSLYRSLPASSSALGVRVTSIDPRVKRICLSNGS